MNSLKEYWNYYNQARKKFSVDLLKISLRKLRKKLFLSVWVLRICGFVFWSLRILFKAIQNPEKSCLKPNSWLLWASYAPKSIFHSMNTRNALYWPWPCCLISSLLLFTPNFRFQIGFFYIVHFLQYCSLGQTQREAKKIYQ